MLVTSARQVAEFIYAEEADDASGGVQSPASAMKSIHQKLAGTLAPILGDTGFKAMFARAVHKEKPAHPWLDDGSADPDGGIDRLWVRLETQEPAAIRAIAVGTLSALMVLLSKFIGDQLTFQLFVSTWPGATASAIASAEKP
jgi:hypothetical protein